jgi:hypothetical protein
LARWTPWQERERRLPVDGRGGQVAPPAVRVWCRGLACLIPSSRNINFVLRVDFGSPTFEGSVSHCCVRWTPRRAGRFPRHLCAAGRATRSDFQAKRRAPPAPPTPKYPRNVPPAPQPSHTYLEEGGNRRRKSDWRAGPPGRGSSRAANSGGPGVPQDRLAPPPSTPWILSRY